MRQREPDPIESPPSVDPSERLDTDYPPARPTTPLRGAAGPRRAGGPAPSSERETEELQDDQAGSPVFDDPDIDRSAVKLLPGTGDYTDDGDVEVDPSDIHLPHLPPGRTDARPPE
ncbi:hypothetical protein [uncultured Amnibacterium sp.]|uniref:hypothetical protein n=1 Tax=uncultured Amnibacterium sp. TaxID=1631851 RepID=UPI0035CBC826